ncbi:NAD-dependent epimerase/dehydratase family protein [Mesorhizobium sp. KR1-2]|uniref:NAD-dependent epimerase/dehydratase family protein n=1 Tax=Mesorhizobium sp. KR1-2 TaxID=3156609 RepID=UPI0032B3AE1D
MRKILITGVSGFVGRHLVARLLREGRDLTLAGRSPVANGASNMATVLVGDIGPETDWRGALRGCGAVVHLAAQVPAPGVANEDFDRVNNRGTARLAEQAFEAGVQCFVLVSSVHAVADNSAKGVVSGDTPTDAATTPYGLSKLAAEAHVAEFSRLGRLGISIRPPLIYGWDAKGNWRHLQRLAASGLPLPFGAVHNRRSFVAVDNLVDALETVVSGTPDPSMSGTYSVADAEAVSLAEIAAWLQEGMRVPPRRLSVPEGFLRLLLRMAGQGRIVRSLLEDLEVDSSRFRAAFGWSPPRATKDAMIASAARYLASRRS